MLSTVQIFAAGATGTDEMQLKVTIKLLRPGRLAATTIPEVLSPSLMNPTSFWIPVHFVLSSSTTRLILRKESIPSFDSQGNIGLVANVVSYSRRLLKVEQAYSEIFGLMERHLFAWIQTDFDSPLGNPGEATLRRFGSTLVQLG